MPPRSRLRWNARAGRYQDARGRFVPPSAVRADIDAAIRETRESMRSLAEPLRARKLSVARWEAAMRQEIKTLHAWNAASAKGGYAQLSPADWGRIGSRVKEQYAFLRRRARLIASGEQRRDGTLTQRVMMYADAGRATFEAIRRREERDANGMTEERSIKHAQDSCQECIAARDAGWQPIGTLPLPGERECLTNCKCEMEYRAA